jgi:hypothetical protein
MARKSGRWGILAPAEPPNWEGSEDWPFAVRAHRARAQLVERGRVSQRFDARKDDRYSHLLAHIYASNDGGAIWIQESLIAKGLARVAAQPDRSACLVPLLAAEVEARAARRGIRRSLSYQIRDAHNPTALGYQRHIYQLVEGQVYGIGEGKKRIYINVGEDWRQDFTTVIARERVPVSGAEGLDLPSLPGQRIRVRGWVEWWNGPMIEISHAQEIEMLDAVPRAE